MERDSLPTLDMDDQTDTHTNLGVSRRYNRQVAVFVRGVVEIFSNQRGYLETFVRPVRLDLTYNHTLGISSRQDSVSLGLHS
jgi:hypothetical protein